MYQEIDKYYPRREKSKSTAVNSIADETTLKIAIISSGFFPVVDGVTVSLQERLQRLSTWGHQVMVFCPDYSPLAHLYPNWKEFTGQILPGVTVITLPSQPLFWGLSKDDRNVLPSTQRRMNQALAQFQPEVIHVDEPERLFFGCFYLPGLRFAKQAGIPCVSFYRTNFIDYVEDYVTLPKWLEAGLYLLVKKILLWVYHQYDLTLVASPITQRKLIEQGFKKTYWADLLGLDLEKFKPTLRQADFFKKEYGLTGVDERLKIIFLGRLRPDKGWGFTLKALPKIVAQIDIEQVAFIIAGDGELQAEIEQEIKKYVPHAHLLGQILPRDVPALLANSDLHITASEKETRGLTVLEALACGLPVLVPGRGGVMQDVQDGWNGFIFKPQDQEDFVTKLKLLVEDDSLRQQMGQNGPGSVVKYHWDDAVQRWLDIVNDLIAQRRETL